MKTKVIQFITNVNLHRLRRHFAHMHSHCYFSVVQEVLHWVKAGELVQDLGAVSDHACGGIYGIHNTRDVDILDVGEVGKLPSSLLVDCLKDTDMYYLINVFHRKTQLHNNY